MIFVDQPTMYFVADSVRAMLSLAKSALCTGCPAGIGAGDPPAAPPPYEVYAVLCSTDPPIVQSLVVADLGFDPTPGQDFSPIQLNDETPPTYCLDMIQGPDVGIDGLWRLVMDQQIWTSTGDAIELYQLAIIVVPAGGDMVTDGMLLAIGRVNGAPAVASAAGDSIKLTAELTPCVCLPPPVPEVPE